MKLVFVTQVLDGEDAVLGFVMRWVQGLAKSTEGVRVLALEAGDLSGLPENVDVRVVGRKGVLRRYVRYRGFLREAFREGFDGLLTHMVPRYSNVAAGLARKHGVRHGLWYTHKAVDARLRKAVGLVDAVFTASEESLRIDTPKKVVTGHGIDLDHFDPRDENPVHPPRLLAVGRLTPSKDPLTLLAALSILVSRGHDLSLDLVGAELGPGDAAYGRTVREQIELGDLEGRVKMHGAVPYREIPAFYRRATLFLSTSMTGSLDKVLLEAMASGRPVISCNDAYRGLVEELGEDGMGLRFEAGQAEQLADRIEAILSRPPDARHALGLELRSIVARNHEVDALMARLAREMSTAT